MVECGQELLVKGPYTYISLQVAKLRWLITFMSAFESLPVHCLYPQASGKRWSLGNKGEAVILLFDDEIHNLREILTTHHLSTVTQKSDSMFGAFGLFVK